MDYLVAAIQNCIPPGCNLTEVFNYSTGVTQVFLNYNIDMVTPVQVVFVIVNTLFLIFNYFYFSYGSTFPAFLRGLRGKYFKRKEDKPVLSGPQKDNE